MSKEKPPTEVTLSALQEKWRINNDMKAYQEMFQIIVQYSRSIILKMTRGKKFLNPDFVFNKAIDVTIKFFEQYETNPKYWVDFSFAGLLRYKVLECLYGPKEKKIDDILSLNSYCSDELGGDKEMETMQSFLHMKPAWGSTLDIEDPVYKMYYTEEATIATVLSVIHDMYNTDFSNRDIMVLLVAFIQTFRKTKTLPLFMEKFFTTTEIKEAYELAMLEIRNRLMEEA